MTWPRDASSEARLQFSKFLFEIVNLTAEVSVTEERDPPEDRPQYEKENDQPVESHKYQKSCPRKPNKLFGMAIRYSRS